ncbi:MAG: hypothetical protein JKX99_09875 [Robiginitomaculum sp.]|nr:hypothetical protein [Robiginitomaculum sp.]
MKIDPHAALLAAQSLRTGDATARGRQASAQFFAELNKAQGTTTPPPAKTRPIRTQNFEAPTQTNKIIREAPLRAIDPSRPTPPGSLLNILV